MLAPVCTTPTHPLPPHTNPAYNAPELARQAVLSLGSPHTRRAYYAAITKFILSGHPLTRSGILAWLQDLAVANLGNVSINTHIAAVRKLVWEVSLRGLITNDELNAIDRIKSKPITGTRAGNWTDITGLKLMLQSMNGHPQQARNQAIIAILAGCGLRRAELCALDWSQFQRRDGRWCFVDIVGKGRRVRTVPIPDWVADYIYQWQGESKPEASL